MRNYSELICNKAERTLTAKGNKFVWKCIDIIAANKNLHRYSKDFKPFQEKIIIIMKDLIIDKGMSTLQITELIKSRKYLN